MLKEKILGSDEYWKLIGAAEHCEKVAQSIEESLLAGVEWQDLGPEDSMKQLRLMAEGYRNEAQERWWKQLRGGVVVGKSVDG